MNKIFISLMFFSALLMTACSEDEPEVGFTNPSDNFIPAADDHSFSAELRRSFKEQTGSYLLFSDTLQHKFLGVNINGNSIFFTEQLDPTYIVGQSNSSNSKYRFTNLENDEQKQMAVDFVKEQILPHVTNKLIPYSWFLCKGIKADTNAAQDATVYTASGQRCIVISFNLLLRKKPIDKTVYANTVLQEIIGQLAVNNMDAFKDFLAYCKPYYGQNLPEEDLNKDDFLKMGFKSSPTISFPNQEDDLKDFVSSILANSQEEIEKEYADYPIILEKFRIAKETLVKLGYKF